MADNTTNPTRKSRISLYVKSARAAGQTDDQIRDELMHDPKFGEVAKMSKESGLPATEFVSRVAFPRSDPGLVAQTPKSFATDFVTGAGGDARNTLQTVRAVTGIDTPTETSVARAAIPETPNTLGGRLGRGTVETGKLALGVLGGEVAGRAAAKFLPRVFARGTVIPTEAEQEANAARVAINQQLRSGMTSAKQAEGLSAPLAAARRATDALANAAERSTIPLIPRAGNLLQSAPRAALEGGVATAASLPEANSTKDFLINAGIGAGLGPAFYGAGRTAASIVDPTRRLSPYNARMFQLLKQEDIPVGATQVTGGPIGKAIQRVAETNPLTSWAVGSGGQQEAINRAILRRMGATEDELATGKITPDIIGAINTRLGEQFDARTGFGPKPLSQDFAGRLADIRARNAEMFKSVASNPAEQHLTKLETLAPATAGTPTPTPTPMPTLGVGVPTVRQSIEQAIKAPPPLGTLKSPAEQPSVLAPPQVNLGDARQQYAALARQARAGNDPKSAETYAAIRDAIDKEIDTHIGSPFSAAPNREYSVLKMVEKPGVLNERGDVVPGPFMRATKGGGATHQFFTNPNEDQQFGAAINMLRDRTPNSGTVSRAVETALIGGGAGALLGGEPGNIPKDIAYGAGPVLLASLLMRSPALATGGQVFRRPISNAIQRASSPSFSVPLATHYQDIFGDVPDQ